MYRRPGSRAKGGVDDGDGGGGGLQGVGQDVLKLLGALFPFDVLLPVDLDEDALLVGVKSSFGGALELGDGPLDVVAQHLRGLVFARAVSLSKVALRRLTQSL